MSHDKWDDAMFCHGSLIGYMAGVKAACKDEDRLDLLLAMVKTQAKLEDVERENAKLRELVVRMYKSIRWSDMTSGSMFSVAHSYEKDMRKLGIEVPDAG